LRLAEQCKHKETKYRSVPGKVGSARVPSIRIESEQEKQHAQYVFPLGRPGHRLDIHRMQRKQRRNHQASPTETGGALQQQK
jgi:hypothetical protein